jgi:hypothetical protein
LHFQDVGEQEQLIFLRSFFINRKIDAGESANHMASQVSGKIGFNMFAYGSNRRPSLFAVHDLNETNHLEKKRSGPK